MQEQTDETVAPEIAATNRRAFMAGAAGLAAGATMIGMGSSPVGASAASDVDVSGLLKWVDTGLNDVDLGTGGAALADFVAEGDAAGMTVRVIVGDDADLGTGHWAIQASTLPSDYRPEEASITAPFGLGVGACGTGVIIDSGNTASYALSVQLQRFPGSPTMLVWGIAGPGPLKGLNQDGDTPFGSAMAPGTQMASTIWYRRITPV